MELPFLEYLARQPQLQSAGATGIGDDAAVLPWPSGKPLVVCTDLIADETDFHLAEVSPQQIGRKALAVNLSDIAAMACQPVGALLTLLLPQGGTSLELAQGIYQGAAQLGELYGCPIVGGDTNTWPGKLAVSVTVMGQSLHERPLLRRGARPGDAVCVTGWLGGSILGHHFEFQPRISQAIRLRQEFAATAGMDLSDGISLDLARLCTQSGVGAEIDIRRLPIAEAALRMSQQSGRPAWWHALNDGEDFELLVTLPPDQAERLADQWNDSVPVTRIGTILPQQERWLIDPLGQRHPLRAQGFSHS